MKYLTPLIYFNLYVVSTVAAPTIIWRGSNDRNEPIHSSETIDASYLVENTVASSKDMSLASIIFLLGRDADGNEALSKLASSGMLPNTASKYEDSDSVYYQVDGLESRHTVARDARKGLSLNNPKIAKELVLDVSLPEVQQKLDSLSEEKVEVEVLGDGSVVSTNKKQRKRNRALDKANVLVVYVDSTKKDDVSDLDATISAAANHPKVGSVVLSGIRSIDEVKRDRIEITRRKLSAFSKYRRSRRRLEEADDAADDGNADDNEVIYYVSLTPNILAGLLFMGLFIFVAYTGIMCMSMIEGQDVFTDKMPHIGREA